MKESLEATLKDVELTKEVYRLYTLEHLTQQEISVKLCCSFLYLVYYLESYSW